MASRWQLTVVALCTLLAASLAHADIYRWDTGEVIPGTEGIEPGPGVDLDHMDLRYAELSGSAHAMDLTEANFEASNLTHASLGLSTLTDANLTGAVVTGTKLINTTSRGFTAAQLYSTQSYQAKDLSGIELGDNDLTGWDFSGQNLTGASFFRSTLTNTNLTGTIVAGTDFADTTSYGFTEEQLKSTASYQQKDLREFQLRSNDLTGWDFSGQDLTNADLSWSTLTNADLTESLVNGASLGDGMTMQQLQSTACYRTKNLQGITLWGDLTGWDFSGQDLTGASFSLYYAGLATPSILTGADFTGAIVVGTLFPRGKGGGVQGFTKEQLYSTASYQAKDLREIGLMAQDLIGWDFIGQNLTGANLDYSTLKDAKLTGANLANASLSFSAAVSSSTLTGADLSGANLKNTRLIGARNLGSALFDSETSYNQWTVFPNGFDPTVTGLTLVTSPTSDFDASDALDGNDIDWLSEEIRGGWSVRVPSWLPDAMFDVNSDSLVDLEDHRIWVKDLKYTWFGDADLNGEFNSGDMVQVFAAGKYEQLELECKRNHATGTCAPLYAGWAEGDWDGDGVFTSSDMVTAFVDGGYEKGPRTDAVAVPEPGGWVLLSLGLVGVVRRRHCDLLKI